MQPDGKTPRFEAGKTARCNDKMTCDIITVVRDPQNFLGKIFTLYADKTISKESSVCVSFGVAEMYRVNTPEELVSLLVRVSEDPRAAVINAVFEGIEVGEEFLILSEREIETRLGLLATDRSSQKGVHQVEYNGKMLKAVGRFKENVRTSNWLLIDRDVDQHTPERFASLSVSDWLAELSKIIPGIDKVTYVETASTSSRVMCDGKPVGGGNGHVWVRVENPDDIERVRTAMIVLAAQAGMTWLKPRYSRTAASTVVAHSLTTIIDPSVWSRGRLVFNGKPTVSEGLTIKPLVPVIHVGQEITLGPVLNQASQTKVHAR